MTRNRRRLSTAQRIKGAGTAISTVCRTHRRLIVVAGCIVLVAASLFEASNILSDTPHFTLAVVDVIGNDHIDSAEITDICGLVPGETNTYTVSLSDVEDACLMDDRIQSVAVRKYLPDRVRIWVREAKPSILVATGDGLAAYDSLANPLFGLPADWIPGLPILTGLEDMIRPVVLPSHVMEDQNQVKARLKEQARLNTARLADVQEVILGALELQASMEAVDAAWLDSGSTIGWTAAAGFEMAMPGRPKLVFGFGRFLEKAEKINLAMSAVALRGRDIEAIYMDNEVQPGAVLLRERSESLNDQDTRAVTQNVVLE